MSARRVVEALNRRYAGDLAFESLRGHSPFVRGFGSWEPSVVFINDYPEPDASGASEVMREMMSDAGIDASTVYFTHVLKYMMPNRPPRPEEVAAAVPYIRREAGALRPVVIAPLGNLATRAVAPGVALRCVHGRPMLHPNGRPVLPLYHPSVARNGELKRALREDFMALAGMLS